MQFSTFLTLVFSALLVNAAPARRQYDISSDCTDVEPTPTAVPTSVWEPVPSPSVWEPIPSVTSDSTWPTSVYVTGTLADPVLPSPTSGPTEGAGDGAEDGAGAADGSSPGSCSAGSAMCCQSVTTPGQANQKLNGLLNGVLGDLGSTLVGLGCTAMPVLGSQCADTPVCCSPSELSGGIGLGCLPVGISL